MLPSFRISFQLLSRVAVVASWLLCSTTARAQEIPDVGPPSPEEPPVAPPPTPRPAPPAIPYSAPPEPEAATILGPQVAHGGYIGPDAKLTSLAGSASLLAGAQGGWIIDHVFVIGGAAYALATDATAPAALQPPSGQVSTLSMTYGGARLAVVAGAKQRLHLVFGILGGGGRISASSSSSDYVADSFFVVEPDAAFEANLARYVRLAIGGSYRFTGGTGIASLGTTAMNGPSAFLTIKLGVF